MLDFRPVTAADTPWLLDLLKDTPELTCDCSPACLIGWGHAQLAPCGGFFVPLVDYGEGPCYLRPLGSGDFTPILPALIEDSRSRGIPFRLYGLTPALRARMGEDFVYVSDRSYFDYLYDIDALCTLAGHKLQSKRNHINRFTEQYPDWRCEPITRALIPECMETNEVWYREHLATGVDPEGLVAEREALDCCFRNYEDFGFDGLLLRAEGRAVAFSLGCPLNETVYDVHFEKAHASMQGAYALINREFSRMVREKYPAVRLLNREDDTGSEGLRKAKLSYHPELILEKSTAYLPEERP